ncbi:MAG TPA: hypothetical protein ENF77_02115 [Candidatus Acetothermia bacterium]|nr:hypothetical protein [Candidatus Acetothermia bacterium]
MRKFIFLGLIGISLLPFAVLAHTGGSATAKLKLDAVINISVTDNWDDLTIDQGSIAGWGAGTVIDWDDGRKDIEVVIKAITDFVLWGCYYAKEGSNDVDPPFGNANDLLILYDGSTDYTLKYKEITDPNAYNGPYNENTLTKLYQFDGDNNIGNGGTKIDYEVKLKPENLGDRSADEEIDFTIVLVVEDPTT